ncbi:MAG: gliding motility-associated C-terminal domain-containing protein [Bacteroidetes bacterium]|nr:gliding motility-associated C-terminal domain-containing protein [Bacteroidota bacterium]
MKIKAGTGCVAGITGNNTICAGDSTTLTAFGGINYSWSTGNTIDSIIVVKPTITTTYSVIITDTCGTDTSSITVFVNPLPNANFSGITSFCNGSSSVLTASGGISYLWSTGETAATIIISPSLSTTYTLIAMNNCGSDTTSIPVTVLSPPVVVISGNTFLCKGNPGVLTASGGSVYSWNTGATTSSIAISPSTNTTSFFVIALNQCGSDTADTTVILVPKTVSSFSYAYDTCVYSCIQFNDQSQNAFYWQWQFGDGDTSMRENPCHFYLSGQYTIMLITLNSFQMCPDTSKASLKYFAADTSLSLIIPNVFTPNGDGQNDAFKISGLNRCSPFSLKIVDRWGGLMFETTDYGFVWDGRTAAGVPAHEGVYFYVFSNNNSTYKGFVSLLK